MFGLFLHISLFGIAIKGNKNNFCTERVRSTLTTAVADQLLTTNSASL